MPCPSLPSPIQAKTVADGPVRARSREPQRASTRLTTPAPWMLLIGDETSLPAIRRRVDKARPGRRIVTIVVLPRAQDIPRFSPSAHCQANWIVRCGDDALVIQARLKVVLPLAGPGRAWLATGGDAAQRVAAYLIEEGLAPRQVRAAGHWARCG